MTKCVLPSDNKLAALHGSVWSGRSFVYVPEDTIVLKDATMGWISGSMGAKVYHNASDTASSIESKSISKDGGRTNYRGLVHISDGAEDSNTNVECDALMFDNESTSDTMPYMEIQESKVDVGHEATVGKIGDGDVLYLQSRGLDDDDARQMIVDGFIEPITDELPIEYAVELNCLIELEMEGPLG